MAKISFALFIVCLNAVSGRAQSDAAQRMIDQFIANEQAQVKSQDSFTVMTETYVQVLRPGSGDLQVIGDHYFLGHASIGSKVTVENLKGTARHRSLLMRFAKRISPMMSYAPDGFAQMAHPAMLNFDRDHYDFTFLRREALDGMNCLVFDVSPKPRYKKTEGMFDGTIWVEEQDHAIIRYLGDFTGSNDVGGYYFHFESRRVRCGPGRWLPVKVRGLTAFPEWISGQRTCSESAREGCFTPAESLICR